MSFSASPSVIVRLPLSGMLLASLLLAGAPSALAASPLVAQDDAAASKDLRSIEKGISDFVHYVLIGKADLAQTAAESVLSASVSDADLARRR